VTARRPTGGDRPAVARVPTFFGLLDSFDQAKRWANKGVSAGTLLQIFTTLWSQQRARQAKSYACFTLITSWHEACSKARGIKYASQQASSTGPHISTVRRARAQDRG